MPNYDVTIDGKDFLRAEFWLVFTDSAAAPRITVRDPSLKREERAMFMSVLLPKALWETPQLKATVSVADPACAPSRSTPKLQPRPSARRSAWT